MAGSVIPWVYCWCDVAPGDVCPGCGRRAPSAGEGEQPLPPLLAGCRRASSSALVGAAVVDLALVAVLLGLSSALAGAGASSPLLVAGILVIAVPAALVSYLRDGRTHGRMLVGLRTVDVFTGTPLRRPAALWGARATSVTLDVRHGRDPVRPLVDPAPAAALVAPDPAGDVAARVPEEGVAAPPQVVIRRSATAVPLSDIVPDAGAWERSAMDGVESR